MPDLTREMIAETREDYDPEAFPDWSKEFPPERELEKEGYDAMRMRWLSSPRNYEPDDLTEKYGKELELVMESFSDETILDLGSSYKSGIAALAGEENNVVQLDIHRYSLDILNNYKREIENREGIEVNSEIIVGDMDKLPFAEDSFGVIFAGASNHLLESSEPLRVLEDRGDMIIGSLRLGNHSDLKSCLDKHSNLSSKIVENATNTYSTDSMAYLENISL